MTKPLGYCHGCLSVDRLLAPIDDFLNIYIKVMKDEIQNISAMSSINIPIMCWECRAMLRNISKFQERTKTAHKYLTVLGTKMLSVSNLSKLSYSFTDDTIDVVHQDDKKFLNNIKLDNDIHTEISIKQEDFNYDDDVKDESFDFEEPKEEYEVAVKEECNLRIVKKEIKVLKKELCDKTIQNQENKLKPIDEKYKIIVHDESFRDREHFKRVIMDENERLKWAELDKSARNYRTMAFKCHLCTTGYATEESYSKHMKIFHLESSGKLQCDICKKRFNCKAKLKIHINDHYIKFKCTLCTFEVHKFWKMTAHLSYAHKRTVLCLTCGLKFETRQDFFKHYNHLHTMLICDYCQKRFKNKENLIRHIKIHHEVHRCYICQKTYSSKDALKSHNNLHHVVSRTEHCYCVECDIQFDNMARYRVHLNTSVKHRPIVGIPCPECNKTYNKRVTMTNHYKYVHLQKTSYYCKQCERYFLNGFRLRQHTASFHNKIRPPKNKLCPHCGRGFQTNRILTNHIRTHTGERPYSCEMCPSTFSQSTALRVHRRAIHKIK